MLLAVANKPNSVGAEGPFLRDCCCAIPLASSPSKSPCSPLTSSTDIGCPLTALWMVSPQAFLVLVLRTLHWCALSASSFPAAAFLLAVLLHLVESVCVCSTMCMSVCCSELDSAKALSCPLAPTLPWLLGDHPPISEKKVGARHANGG
uniref:Uncharacterized protein n=1 Tax=Myotis myotis TaxID=51298 RepID=A0A7J8AMM8_MYOMY|nr:hypothetical protein mMyoMyo1_008156 [Myotis myotis]